MLEIGIVETSDWTISIVSDVEVSIEAKHEIFSVKDVEEPVNLARKQIVKEGKVPDNRSNNPSHYAENISQPDNPSTNQIAKDMVQADNLRKDKDPVNASASGSKHEAVADEEKIVELVP